MIGAVGVSAGIFYKGISRDDVIAAFTLSLLVTLYKVPAERWCALVTVGVSAYLVELPGKRDPLV